MSIYSFFFHFKSGTSSALLNSGLLNFIDETPQLLQFLSMQSFKCILPSSTEHIVSAYNSVIVRYTGADPGFQVRGAHLKKLRRAEGGAKNFGVFRVKNHDFTPKKIRFIPNAEGSAKIFGVFRVKNHDFTPKKSDFFQMQREARKFLGYFV